MKKTFLIFVVLTVLLIFPSISLAGKDIDIQVEAGYNGMLKEGAWGPVVITVSNKGQNFEGELNIVTQRDIRYVIPLQLAQGSIKRYQIYLPQEILTNTVEVKMVSNGALISKTNIKLHSLGFDVPVIGYITDVGLTLPQYFNIRDGYFIPLKLSELPERIEPLSNFNLIIISNVETSMITKEQFQSLLLWVERGGHLLISGGPNWQKTFKGLPNRIKPLDVIGLKDLVVSDLNEPITVSYGRLKPGFKILEEIDKVPVIAESRYGNGSIMFSAFDMVEFLSKQGSQGLYMDFIQPKVVFPKEHYYREVNPMHWTLRNIPADDFYSPNRMGLIFLLYVLIIGPINFYILKRFDKRELAWITIPALVIIFTVGLYSSGFGNKGLRVLTNTITVTTLSQEGEIGTREVYVGFFSPQGHIDRIMLEDDYLVSGFQTFSSNDSGIDKIYLGEKTIVVFSRQNLWNMKTFAASTMAPSTGKIVGNVGFSSTGLNGQLKNDTIYDLEGVIIITPAGYAYIEEFLKGETIDLSLLTFTAGNWQHRPGLIQFPNNRNPQDLLRNNILSNMYNVVYLRPGGYNPINGKITLMGWIKDTQNIINVKDIRGLHVENNLIVSYLNFDFWDNNTFYIPMGFLMPEDYSMGGYYKLYHGSYVLEDGELFLTYRLPEIKKEEVTDVRFQYVINDPNFLPDNIEIYNVNNGTWEQGVIVNNSPLNNKENYIDSNSFIKIKITKPQSNQRYQPLYIDSFNIEVRGER